MINNYLKMMIVLVFCLKKILTKTEGELGRFNWGSPRLCFPWQRCSILKPGLGDEEGRLLFRKHLVCACWQRSKILRIFILKMLVIVWEQRWVSRGPQVLRDRVLRLGYLMGPTTLLTMDIISKDIFLILITGTLGYILLWKKCIQVATVIFWDFVNPQIRSI